MSQVTAPSGSSLVVSAVFRNESDVLVVPDSIHWTLTDGIGNIINEREDVEIETPASTIHILLGPDDLVPMLDTSRIITIRAVYISSLIPSEEMTLIGREEFYIENITQPV